MAEQKTIITRVHPGPTIADAGGESCLVVIYGPGLGKRIPLRGPELQLGRDPANHVVVDLDNVSRRHCSLRMGEGEVYVRDHHSTNGTFVNDVEIQPGEELLLRSGDLLRIGGAILKFLQAGNVEALYHEEIYRTIIVDGLTQVHTKRYFLEFLDREMSRCNRWGRPLSLIMFDVDHFKNVNDELGHLAGDHVLRELAGMVRGTMIRKEELLARYGGEEFVIVLPESPPPKVRVFAEKLRSHVEEHPFVFEGRRIPITISIGVADMTGDMTEPAHFIKAADEKLYAAKRNGRNCVAG